MGRVGIDIYPLEVGVELAEVETFGRFLGGSATNVAVAAARYGHRSAVITRTGRDPFGDYVHRALREFSVDDRWVTAVNGLPTPVTFCAIMPPDRFPAYFYRYPKAPDLEIRPEDLDLDAIRSASVLWLTGTGLSAEPSRSAHFAALKARSRAPFTILDLDYRPALWSSPDDARASYAEALNHVSVAVGNIEECLMAVGESEPRTAAEALIGRGVDLAVVKQGERGSLALTVDELVEEDPVEVEVVNGIGAGDAFGGALCHGLLNGWPLGRMLRFGNAAGAIVASRLACSSAMPTSADVVSLLSERGLD